MNIVQKLLIPAVVFGAGIFFVIALVVGAICLVKTLNDMFKKGED